MKSPVRLFADPDRDLLVLRSDVPISALNAPAFAEDLTVWLDDNDVLPVFLTGFPVNREPDVYGVATGDAAAHLDDADVDPPEGRGLISGPAGALLSRTRRRPLDAVGLVVETDPRFPDSQGGSNPD